MHSNTIGKSGANNSPNFSKMNGTTFGSIQRADMWKLGGSFEGYPEWYFTYSSMGGRWVTPVDRPADWIPSCEVVCTERLPGVIESTSWTSPSIWGATVTCNQDDIMKFSALRLFPTTWHRYHVHGVGDRGLVSLAPTSHYLPEIQCFPSQWLFHCCRCSEASLAPSFAAPRSPPPPPPLFQVYNTLLQPYRYAARRRSRLRDVTFNKSDWLVFKTLFTCPH